MNQVKLEITSSTDIGNLAQWAPSIGASGWYILQSYSRLTFRAWNAGEALPALGEEFAGTLFGPDAEIRWTREKGEVRIWQIRDLVGATHRKRSRSYYGWGYWENGRFWEPELEREVVYPVAAGVAPGEKARPRFQVVEYSLAKPAAWPTEAAELQRVLNEPVLSAYRLAGFDFGKDGEAR